MTRLDNLKRYRLKMLIWDGLISTALTLLSIAVLPLVLEFKLLESFKVAFSDFQITDANYSDLRDPSIIAADENIVIIDIENLTNQGLTMLITKLNSYQPKVIGIDHELDIGNELEDLALVNALAETRNLVFSELLINPDPSTLESDSMKTSDSIFIVNSDRGFSNLLIGKDKRYNTVREFYPTAYLNGEKILSFPVMVAKYFDSAAVDKLLKRGLKSEIINYRGNISKFYFQYGLSILEGDQDLEFVKDKIVLLGVDGFFRGYDKLKDLYFTPMNERSSGRTFPDMSGLVIHANLISMICSGSYCESMPSWLSYLIAIILCFTNMMIFSYICIANKKWFEIGSLLIFVLESMIILGLTVAVFDSYNYQMKLTEALFAIALSVFMFQIYNESLKPVFTKAYRKLFKKG